MTGTALTCILVLLSGSWLFLRHRLTRWLSENMTVLYDLPRAGIERKPEHRIKGTAVICGGSIAGLWSARVCADHFDDVLVIEPEAWVGTEEGRTAVFSESGARLASGKLHDRTRVMQYGASHGFQVFGLSALRHFFPAVDEELRRTDVRIKPADFNVHVSGIRTQRLPDHEYLKKDVPEIFFGSRETFERLLRRLVVKSSSRIRYLAGTVTGLHPAAANNNVIDAVSVRLDEGGAERLIPAAVVIDCTGRTQAGLKWVKRLSENRSSYPDPTVDNLRISYDARMRHTTFRFPVLPSMRSRLPIPSGYDAAGWVYVFFPTPPGEHRSISASRIEGHRIEIGCGGWGEPSLPNSPSEIIEWAKTLRGAAPVPDWVFEMINILRENENEATVLDTRIPACSWIRYERSSHLPTNFAAVGDSVMTVNPVFGQGCSKACIGAITLDSVLRYGPNAQCPAVPDSFSAQFFKKHADKIADMWNGTKPTDYAWETTIPVKGESLNNGKFAREYGRLLGLLSMTDKKVNSAIWHSRMFLSPSTDVFHPSILTKALLLAVREYLGFEQI